MSKIVLCKPNHSNPLRDQHNWLVGKSASRSWRGLSGCPYRCHALLSEWSKDGRHLKPWGVSKDGRNLSPYACFWYFVNEDFKCELAIESLLERKSTGSLLEWTICDDSDQWESLKAKICQQLPFMNGMLVNVSKVDGTQNQTCSNVLSRHLCLSNSPPDPGATWRMRSGRKVMVNGSTKKRHLGRRELWFTPRPGIDVERRS